MLDKEKVNGYNESSEGSKTKTMRNSSRDSSSKEDNDNQSS